MKHSTSYPRVPSKVSLTMKDHHTLQNYMLILGDLADGLRETGRKIEEASDVFQADTRKLVLGRAGCPAFVNKLHTEVSKGIAHVQRLTAMLESYVEDTDDAVDEVASQRLEDDGSQALDKIDVTLASVQDVLKDLRRFRA